MMMQEAPKMHHNEVVTKMHRLNNAAKFMMMQEAPKMHHNEVVTKNAQVEQCSKMHDDAGSP